MVIPPKKQRDSQFDNEVSFRRLGNWLTSVELVIPPKKQRDSPPSSKRGDFGDFLMTARGGIQFSVSLPNNE
jgi:hypothetical protein